MTARRQVRRGRRWSGRPGRGSSHGPRDDAGTAVVEFVWLAVLLMVPVVYVLLGLFDVQRAAFAVTEAARQAGRTYVTSGCDAARAQRAADLALGDQGLRAVPVSGLRCPEAGGAVTVQVRYLVRLRGLGALLPTDRGGVPVSGSFVAVRDRFTVDGGEGRP